MTIFVPEPIHAGAFLLMEQPGFSRDTIMVASGAGVLPPGTVLGKRITGAASAVARAGGNTGTGSLIVDATPVLANATVGTYQVRFTSATTFRVTDQKGAFIGDGTVGTAFVNRINFNTAAGSTAFVAGDGFDISVTSIAAKYVAAPASATDGSDVAVGVLFDRVDATSADAAGVIVFSFAEVRSGDLTYDASVNSAGLVAIKNAQLAAEGVAVRV